MSKILRPLFETFSPKSNLSSSDAGNKGELLSISETMLLTLPRWHNINKSVAEKFDALSVMKIHSVH